MPLHPDSFRGRLLLTFFDKLVIGVLAALIVICFQTYTQDREDRRQQLIVAARLESQFIDSTLKEVNRNMDEYYRVATKIIDIGRKMEYRENSKMVEYKTAVERSLFLLGKLGGPDIISEKHKESFDNLIRSTDELDSLLQENPKESPKRRENSLAEVENNHREVLLSLREAALAAVRLERNIPVTKGPASEADQAEGRRQP